MKRLVVLASGSGSNLQALIGACEAGELPAEIVAVVSDRPAAGALQRAERAGIPAISLPLRHRSDAAARVAYDRLLAETVAMQDPDLVVLAGWMVILGESFLNRFPGSVVNVHPALLPDGPEDEVVTSQGVIPALRGAHAVRDALALGLPVTGATVHFVTPIVDTGPVILRAEAPILANDDERLLHERIKSVEHQLLPRAIALALAEDAPGGSSCRQSTRRS